MGSSVKSILASRDYSSSSESEFGSKKRLTNQGTKIPAGIAPRVTAQIDGNIGSIGPRHGME